MSCDTLSIQSETHTDDENTFDTPKANRHRKNAHSQKKQILTPRLAAVLDKLKVSQRDAVHLLVAVLDALGQNPSDFVLNRNSIREQRAMIRKSQSQKIMHEFATHNHPLTIHWDTKLLPSITGQQEDRLAIIATAPGIEQIIDIPDIPSGTGLEISSAVYDALDNKNILQKAQAFVFDTTASNTGRLKGACNLLERSIGRDILFLGCRHHICEIVLAGVFIGQMGASTGPNVDIFKKFKNHWPKINRDNFSTGLTHPRINEILGDDTAEILNFAYHKIAQSFARDDYKEFLELVIIFLGGTPPRGIQFKKPGALHHARWMAKAIYSLKILIFRDQFPQLTNLEINGLIEVVGFIIKCYLNLWFDSNKADKAPLNDLKFLRQLEMYKNINKQIADRAISKIINHLYYLSEECVAFVLFDERIDNDIKGKLVRKMLVDANHDNEDEDHDCPKKLSLSSENLSNFISRDDSIILEDLFSQNTKKFFKRFDISMDFFTSNPESWNDLEGYQKGKNIVKNLNVVNDSAERAIKLVQDYHDKITKDEEQRQYLLKV